jgi:hypothetical protein
MRGRYPDYDVLEQAPNWDRLTREAVLARVDGVPEIRFFTTQEARALRAFCDVVLAQHEEPRIPVLEMVDAKLTAGRGDGFRYADMPADRDTWRIVARALDESAQLGRRPAFAEAPLAEQQGIVERFARGELAGAAAQRLNVGRAWKVTMRSVLEAFYSHPWSWNEIGFGGPAYPRGYVRLGIDLGESWEAGEALDVDPVSDVAERGL